MTLEIRHLSVHAPKKSIISNLSLGLKVGDFLAILGPSGSGKTTLIKTILGLNNNLTIQGEISFEGEILQKDQCTLLPLRKRRFGYIPQQLKLWPHLSVHQALNLSATWSGCLDKHWPDHICDLVGLSAHRHQKPHDLSGGEQQRLALARVLVARPRLIIFDEPLSALDIIAKADLICLIQQAKASLGFGAILITHDIAEALALADSIVILIRGQKIWSGPQHLIHEASFPPDWQLLASPLLRPIPQALFTKIDSSAGEHCDQAHPPSGY